MKVIFTLFLLTISLGISGLRSVAPSIGADHHGTSREASTLSTAHVFLFECTQTPPLTFNFTPGLSHPTFKEHLKTCLPDGQMCQQFVEHIRLSRYLSSTETLVPGLSSVSIAFPFHYFY